MVETIRLKEGKVEVEVPKVYKKGPGKKSIAYYSTSMVVSRDLTIFIIKNALKEGGHALDLLGGSGIRGFRIEKECNFNVTINEKNRESLVFIKNNANINNSKAKITELDAKRCTPNGFFDYIVVDPYGSPVPFLDPALKAIKNNGVLGITATDVSNFAGTNPDKTWYLYHSIPLDNYLKHEVGIRILIGYIARKASEYNFGIFPLLSYFGGYYYRVFIKLKRGKKEVLKSLSLIQEINFIKMFKRVGPIWIGNLHDLKDFKIPDYLQSKKEIEKIINISKDENRLFFFSTEELGKKLKIDVPKIERLIEKLKEEGFSASRTQFSNVGLKTNATLPKINKILKSN